jgi:hypothetical protein
MRAKQIKTFKATWRPAGGRIRVVLVKEEYGWLALLSIDATTTAEEILSAAADRFSIERDFHDLKEVDGLGREQMRGIRPAGCPAFPAGSLPDAALEGEVGATPRPARWAALGSG